MDDQEVSVSRSIGVPGWAGFRRAHLHDYSPAAVRFWLALALIGTFALVLSGVRLAQLDAAELWQILGWSAIAAGVVLLIAVPLISRLTHEKKGDKLSDERREINMESLEQELA